MKVSVCIPTRNRPDDVVACVNSVHASSVPVVEIIVSDDSPDDRTRRIVAERCEGAIYLSGPRRGLGANRNNAILAATGDWILFLDDDARLAPEFLAKLAPLMEAEQDGKTIFTGIERNDRGLIYPKDQSFLGFQNKAYRPGAVVRTLVMNAAVFPTAMLRAVNFDPTLVYGYDEIDIAARAIARGYQIRLCPDAVNLHFSSPLNRDFNAPHVESSRIYVTYRKYCESQRQPLKAKAFLGISLVHSLLHSVKEYGPRGVVSALNTHRAAWSNIRRIAL